MVKCSFCGKDFVPRLQRKWRPQKYCSKGCREIAHREHMREYNRQRRLKKYQQIHQSHLSAYQELMMSSPERQGFDDEGLLTGRIALNHDSWDFIPSYYVLVLDSEGKEVIEKVECYQRIGTLTERDLRLIEVDGQLRVAAAVKLKKKGEKKEE